MQAYPFISVIFLGDNSITEIDVSLKSLLEIHYPQDQLEYYLVVPYHRPLSEFVKNYPKLKIIRFDETIKWSQTNALLEGLSFANGDYIQIFNTNYSLHSKWLKTSLQYLKDHKLFAVTGNDVLKSKNSSNTESFNIVDGLYNTKILKHCIDDYIMEQIRSDCLNDLNNICVISDPMIDLNKSQHHQFLQQNPVSNRIRSILSKYVLVK